MVGRCGLKIGEAGEDFQARFADGAAQFVHGAGVVAQVGRDGSFRPDMELRLLFGRFVAERIKDGHHGFKLPLIPFFTLRDAGLHHLHG